MFRFLLNFIGFLLSFVFTEKIMHEVWHLRNVIYSSIVRCHFKSIGKGGRFCYPLILNGGKNILIGDKFSLHKTIRLFHISLISYNRCWLRFVKTVRMVNICLKASDQCFPSSKSQLKLWWMRTQRRLHHLVAFSMVWNNSWIIPITSY